MLRASTRLITLACLGGIVAAVAPAAGAPRPAPTYEFFYTTAAQARAEVWRASFVPTSRGFRLTRPVATADAPSAHGIALRKTTRGRVLDRYTGDLILPRNHRLIAADPRYLATISALGVVKAVGARNHCQRVSTDDRGQLVISCGRVVALIALTSDRRLDAPGTTVTIGRLPVAVVDLAPSFISGRTRVRTRCRRHCTRPAFTG